MDKKIQKIGPETESDWKNKNKNKKKHHLKFTLSDVYLIKSDRFKSRLRLK